MQNFGLHHVDHARMEQAREIALAGGALTGDDTHRNGAGDLGQRLDLARHHRRLVPERLELGQRASDLDGRRDGEAILRLDEQFDTLADCLAYRADDSQ